MNPPDILTMIRQRFERIRLVATGPDPKFSSEDRLRTIDELARLMLDDLREIGPSNISRLFVPVNIDGGEDVKP